MNTNTNAQEKNSNPYHRVGCSRIGPRLGYMRFFWYVDDAEREGFSPCTECKPNIGTPDNYVVCVAKE